MEPESTNNPLPTEGQVPVEIIRPGPEVVKPFTEHLEDLRSVLIKSLLTVVVTGAVCFYFTESIIRFYEWPLTSLAQIIPMPRR